MQVMPNFSHRRVHRLLVAILMVFAFASSAGASSDNDNAAVPNAGEAARIAYAGFERELTKQYAGEVPNKETAALLDFSRDPRNYDMGISQTDDIYVVVFLPRRTPAFEYIIGGGGRLEISKSDSTIRRFIWYR